MKRLMQRMMMLAPLVLVAQTSNVVLPQDKGPDKIDIGAYQIGRASCRERG